MNIHLLYCLILVYIGKELIKWFTTNKYKYPPAQTDNSCFYQEGANQVVPEALMEMALKVLYY